MKLECGLSTHSSESEKNPVWYAFAIKHVSDRASMGSAVIKRMDGSRSS